MLFKLCNKILNFNMLGETDIVGETGQKVYDVIKSIMTWVFTFAGIAVVAYAIYLAVVFFRADSADKREEAKKRLIFAVIGVVACILIIVVVQWLIPVLTGLTGIDKAPVANV